jgi:hypothetical protein
MEKLVKYQNDLGEKASEILFENAYNLKLKKIPRKKNYKTPDYEIKDSNGKIIAICEIKSCIDSSTAESVDFEISGDDLLEISKHRERNYKSKLERHHNKAMSQLSSYPDIPILIIFVSFDMTDYIDMHRMLQEDKELYPMSQMADAYLIMKVHQGLIPSDVFEIKDVIRMAYSNKRGEVFLNNYLPQSKILKNVGTLPLTFKIK